jgi:hypothetical protein
MIPPQFIGKTLKKTFLTFIPILRQSRGKVRGFKVILFYFATETRENKNFPYFA